jgi:hexosaminidase
MLLDVSRHFMTRDFVKRLIDLLALYKMNRFHWHLTDDQGWRLAMDRYPRLTEVGAWRVDSDGSTYGGFYSQDDVREVIAHAQARCVAIVPEIDMPGHSLAALAAYPEFSCTGGPFDVETRWGIFRDVYCVGNDKTFAFLEGILDEVMSLFPDEYIHIGGDECPKKRWRDCPRCKERIQQEDLSNETELQGYFTRRIGQFLSSRGRKVIGWDEILEGGTAPEMIVQSWRGIEGALAAARSGHDAIVSPTSHAYFDYHVAMTDLRKVYSLEPVPEDLDEALYRHILGGECNLWTERIRQEDVDAMLFPRMLAMAECLWSPPARKDFVDFHRRVRAHYARLDALGVAYGKESGHA